MPHTLADARLGQVAVRVLDVERATTHYREVLGLRFLFAAPGLAFFQCGETRLMLGRAETAEFDHASSILYFSVDDVIGTHAALAARGVPFRGAPHVVHRTPQSELWMAAFEDGEGNVFAVMTEKPLGGARA